MSIPGEALSGAMEELIREVAAEVRSEVIVAIRAELGSSGPVRSHRWLDTKEAAAYLGVHPDTIGKAASRGEIPSEQGKPGAKRWFEPHKLDEWRRGQLSTRDAA